MVKIFWNQQTTSKLYGNFFLWPFNPLGEEQALFVEANIGPEQ